MIRMIMHGCNGRMGQMISDIVTKEEDVSIVAGIDVYGGKKNDYPVFEKLESCNIEADVLVDFTGSAAFDGLMDWCVDKNMPCVLCSTGLNEIQLKRVEESAKKIAILRSANMSMGINTLMKVLKEVAPVFAKAGFDIEVVEKHHNQKLDAPSGTALALADSVNEAFEEKYEYVYDRSSRREIRPKKEIGISAIRGGTIVGDHDVIFAGTDEVVAFSHMAYSRAVFAKGAVSAAKFLAGKQAGMYDMADVIEG